MDELKSVCGLGTVTGLCGANCYHSYSPFIPGISKRTYTDEELESMKREELTPREYGGKQYTKYEALQRQRKLETTMRAQRQKIKLLETGGANEDDIINARCRYRGTSAEYARFSKAMDLPQQRDRVYIDGLGDVGKGKYTKKVSQNEFTNHKNDDIINSGAISGALSPDSEAAEVHAFSYYESVRHMKNDVSMIAKNTGFSVDDIQIVKNFIFMDKHDLGNGEFEYFYPSYTMAQSWQRLIDGKDIKHHDITLLKHEIMEHSLIEKGYSQSDAHLITSKKYNYDKEATEYYDKIDRNSKKE